MDQSQLEGENKNKKKNARQLATVTKRREASNLCIA